MKQKLAVPQVEDEEDSFDASSDLPKLVFFGDEIIELDESMLSALCNECETAEEESSVVKKKQLKSDLIERYIEGNKKLLYLCCTKKIKSIIKY